MNDDNKDYIINIRVSKETYSKLKHKAKENSETLSTLVRKTLDDSWEIFNDIKKDIFNEGKNGEAFEYFQKVIVTKQTSCNKCLKTIGKGEQAFLGETKSGTKKYFCEICFSNS